MEWMQQSRNEAVEAWIGLTDIKNEGQYVWGSGLEKSIISKHWRNGQPNNFHRNQHCIMIKKVQNMLQLEMNDIECDKKLQFVCQRRIGRGSWMGEFISLIRIKGFNYRSLH